MRNTKNCEDSLYLKNPLPADVQIKLVKLAQSGSKEAQDELVETNMRFVRMIVLDILEAMSMKSWIS